MALPEPVFGWIPSIPDWPTDIFEGLIKALGMWLPEPRLDHSGCPALPYRKGTPFASEDVKCGCRVVGINEINCYVGTRPAYPDHPNAVEFNLNFVQYSFGVKFVTDNPDQITRLRAAIADAMARPEYAEHAIEESRRNVERYGEAWKGWPPGHPCHGIDTHVLKKE